MQIANDKIEGLKINLGFNTTINGQPTALTPNIDFSGMPVTKFVEIFWAGFKVKMAPVIKSLGVDKAISTFDRKPVSWVTCLSQTAAKETASIDDMNDDQLAIMIEKLEARKAELAAAKLAESENVRV